MHGDAGLPLVCVYAAPRRRLPGLDLYPVGRQRGALHRRQNKQQGHKTHAEKRKTEITFKADKLHILKKLDGEWLRF